MMVDPLSLNKRCLSIFLATWRERLHRCKIVRLGRAIMCVRYMSRFWSAWRALMRAVNLAYISKEGPYRKSRRLHQSIVEWKRKVMLNQIAFQLKSSVLKNQMFHVFHSWIYRMTRRVRMTRKFLHVLAVRESRLLLLTLSEIHNLYLMLRESSLLPHPDILIKRGKRELRFKNSLTFPVNSRR